MLRLSLIAVFVGILLVGSGQAAAQGSSPPTGQARRHFETGTQAFDTGDYELAMTEFQRAYELTHHPDLLFNIYSSAERAGNLAAAADALERFLSEGNVEGDRRPALEQRLARLRQRIAASQSGTEVPTEEPTEEPAEEPTEEPTEPTEEPTPEPAPAPSGGVHPAAIALLVTAGVLLASFAVFAGLSEVEDGNLAAGCGAARACSESELSTLSAYNIVADVSWIAAAVSGVVGVVLLFALPAESSTQSAAVLAPYATPDGAGLVLAGRF